MTKDEERALRRIPTGRLIEWRDGMPVPVYAPILSNAQITQTVRASLSFKYEPRTDADGNVLEEEKKFDDMTCLEVGMARTAQKAAEGDLDSLNMMLDRTVGKAKQHIETVNVNVTLADALDLIADMMEGGKETRSVIDVTPQPGTAERHADLW